MCYVLFALKKQFFFDTPNIVVFISTSLHKPMKKRKKKKMHTDEKILHETIVL